MKKVLFLFIGFIIASRTDLSKVKISSRDSHITLEKICKEVDNITASKLRTRYKIILMQSETIENGKVAIISKYGIRYEDLSFKDLIENLNTNP